MPEKPFVINDRRKFTAEGELRHDGPASEHASPDSLERDIASSREPTSSAVTSQPEPSRDAGGESIAFHAESPDDAAAVDDSSSQTLPPPPTAEQTAQATRAYDATVERLDTAIRATDPGGERMPEMNFERLVQSLYMQTILQLGGAAERGQQPQIDLLGARQSIDMLGVIAAKTKGNLSEGEQRLVDSALFEMRMAFLDVTQALARQSAARQGGAVPPVPAGGGPRIVR